jgi:hypothetical protein
LRNIAAITGHGSAQVLKGKQMRVKMGNTWYDAKNVAICIEMDEFDKHNLVRILGTEQTKYAVFPDNDSRTDEELRNWMRE